MPQVKNYLSLVKFSHTLFAMPFALIGFSLAIKAQAQFDAWLLAYVLLCMVFARNAAMGFNRYLDRRIDEKNPRTATREIPAGVISPRAALAFVVLNSVAFWVVTWFINTLVFWLAPVALFVVLGYSFTKRFTALCHFVLGLGLSLAPIGAYLAVTAHFAVVPVLFSVLVLFWVSGFDIIYALQDEEFDRQQALHSVPTLLGRKGALALARVLHLFSIVLVFAAGWYGQLPPLYYIGALVFSLLIANQHRLVKPDDLSRINLAFFTTNGVASVLFAVITISALIWG